MFSLGRRDNDTSVVLDLLRVVAAQMVCLGHGLVFFHMPGQWRPPQWPYLQNIGVLLFFIMSGFLITATLAQNAPKADYGFKRYFIDRFARIYSGLVPALLFIAAVDAATLWLANPTSMRSFNIGTLIANLVMLEGHKGIYEHTSLQWAAFGSASPLWTLAIEWHIYMFVGAMFFIYRERPLWVLLVPVALLYGQAPLHYLFGAFQPDGVGTGLFALWLGGAAIYLALRQWVPPLWISVPTLACAAAAYGLLLTPTEEYAAVTYPALVLLVGALIALTQRTRAFGAGKLIRLAADYSFTLYLIHHTIMVAITTIYPAAEGNFWFWGAVVGSNIIAYLIARPFEMQHRRFADWLYRKFSLPVEVANPASVLVRHNET